MTPTFQLTSLHSSVSSTLCSKPDSHMKRPSDTSSIQPPHTWWDESQLDLDLADDSILGIGPEEQLNRKQRFKQKLITTMKHTHPSHTHNHNHQRSSWLSSSSSNSSLSSAHSLSTPSLSQPSSSYSKLSRPFVQLKHLLKKH
ncbi:hypothetical protein [Absidia glauca]|uniref:Uncharacterized protein n=1 Tax=Absidia glauca TaxID=4829 RepID=A0A168SU47_ABSGL|nr:hypothetical protein [Absidia glauca]